MASIGNGHISTNVFSDSVYMNGLYNGREGESHRATIPSYANIRLDSNFTQHFFDSVYSLDTTEGAFKVKQVRGGSIVLQRIYAHRYYTRAIVNQFQVISKHRNGKVICENMWSRNQKFYKYS